MYHAVADHTACLWDANARSCDRQSYALPIDQGPLLWTWVNLNLSMDKWLHSYKVREDITYQFRNLMQPLEVSEWIINFIDTLLGIWLVIHAGIKVDLSWILNLWIWIQNFSFMKMQ